MKITRTDDFIKLDQAGYVREILEKYKHLLRGLDSKRANTPMERDLKLRKSESESMTPSQREYVSKFPYQNLVGALLYLAINTRPDISYTVRLTTFDYGLCSICCRWTDRLAVTTSDNCRSLNDGG